MVKVQGIVEQKKNAYHRTKKMKPILAKIIAKIIDLKHISNMFLVFVQK